MVAGGFAGEQRGQLTALVYALGVTHARRIFPDHRPAACPPLPPPITMPWPLFLEGGGCIPLGLLGLGADGHTASLFSLDDVDRGRGRLAIPVQRESGPQRVS